MAEVTRDEVLAALSKIIDPDKGQDIVSLGMVSGVQLRDGHITFAIEVERARAPKLEALRKDAEKAVDAIPGVLSVTAVLTAEKPAQRPTAPYAKPQQRAGMAPPAGHGHGHAHGPEGAAAQKPAVEGVKHIVAVASGKGGVGKSTTAVNLALALKTLGLKVGVLDADIYGPSMPRMLGISGKPRSNDGKTLEPMENHGLKCMSMGFLVAEDTPTIWRGPMVMSALQQMLRQVNWGELDVMVVDMPPGTGDAQLTMAQQVPLAGAVIVSTPQDIALQDARKGLNMFRRVDVPVLGFIENMSYFLCPHCNERTDIFSHGGAKAEAEKLGVEFLGELPLDIAIRETSDGGNPIVVAQPDSQYAATYRAIAARLWQILGGRQQRQAPTIVVE
ncbi:MAG TPA: iron-sulfur cluster carrier protein ApbC [Stellaceae bacterium]|jgi:ATP-binding protein involved in chromosome partitioning|nr:iron-sulfur cluster carrier protein ApbC [Stellaceae bacterium]